MEQLEREVGDWTETIDYSDGRECLKLPMDIYEAAKKNDIQKVLNWLGPPPVDKQRINAKNADLLDTTLVFCAVLSGCSDLLSILLQLGADVDSIACDGATPLRTVVSSRDNYAQARLLLEWGSRCLIVQQLQMSSSSSRFT